MTKIKSALLILVLFGCPTCWAAIPFNGQAYDLALVDVDEKSGTITNEFLRKGETLTRWNILVSARYFPKAQSTVEVAGAWLAMLKGSAIPGMSVRQEKISGKTTEQEIMFYASLRAPDDSYLELCHCRIVKEAWNEGIKMYQVSRRVDPKNEKKLMAAFGEITTFTEQVKAMLIEVVTKK